MAAVVVGPDADAVAAEARRILPDAESSCRPSAAAPPTRCWPRKSAIARGADDILVIFGDTPMIRPQTLMRMRAALPRARRSRCSASGRRTRPAMGGWCWTGGELVAIREELDASPAERALDLCNGGLMAFAGPTALAILERIGNDNRKGEYYLTDAIAIARAMGLEGGRDRDRGGRRARHQHQGTARGDRSRAAAAPAQGGDGGGRDPGRARNRVSGGRHQVRPRRGGGAVCRVRARASPSRTMR